MAFFSTFSKLLLVNRFFNRIMFRTNGFMTNFFFDNTKLPTENISICCFLSNPGPKFTPSSNRLDTGEKLIITSSVTKDVYIRPCISLIRHHMQIYTSTSGLFTRILVVRNSFFNHNWWLKRFYVSK